MTRKYKTLEINKRPKEGFCRIILNGTACSNLVSYRGICNRCGGVLSNRGLLKKFALPAVKVHVYKSIELKKRVKKGYCRVRLDGVGCTNKATGRAMCGRCGGIISYRGIADQFALPPIKKRVKKFTINRNHAVGCCRMLRDGEVCEEKVSTRGICRNCIATLNNRGLYERYALKSKIPYDAKYTVNKEAGPYECRLLTNGKKCNVVIHSRGLCKKHYRLAGEKNKLKKFALKAYNNKKRAIGLRNYNYKDSR